MAIEIVGEGIHNHVCDECSEILEEGCTLTDCDEEEVELCALHSGEQEAEEEEDEE